MNNEDRTADLATEPLNDVTTMVAERQRLIEDGFLQGVMLDVTEKPRSSPCAPPQYLGRLRRVDQQPFEDGKVVHWIAMAEVAQYQQKIQAGERITLLTQAIQRLQQ